MPVRSKWRLLSIADMAPRRGEGGGRAGSRCRFATGGRALIFARREMRRRQQRPAARPSCAGRPNRHPQPSPARPQTRRKEARRWLRRVNSSAGKMRPPSPLSSAVATLPRGLSATAEPAICGPFLALVNDQNCPRARRFVFILVMYHSWQTDFTLSAADDLMYLLAGFSPSRSTCLVMPAPLANKRKKAND